MKNKFFFPAGVICAILAVRTWAAPAVVTDWPVELNAVQQASHQDAGGRARAGDILRAANAAARNGLEARASANRPAEPVPTGVNRDAAVAHAAYSAMTVLYPQSLLSLDNWLAASLAGIDDGSPAIAAGKAWGEHVAEIVLADQTDAVFLNPNSFAGDVRSPGIERLADAAQNGPDSLPVPALPPQAMQVDPGRYRLSVLAGAPGSRGHVDGKGEAARFDNPAGLAVDMAGNVYVSEQDMHTIRKISPDGVVTTLAGMAEQSGNADGAGSTARFNQPQGLAVDRAGNVYVADRGNFTVRKIDPSGMVTTLAGAAGKSGFVDGTGEVVRFSSPTYVAVDVAGFVFVAEKSSGRIRRITPDGTVASLEISLPSYYQVYSPAPVPNGLCVDHSGALYALYSEGADFVNDVLKITATASGRYESRSVQPGSLPFEFWGIPRGVALDDADNLYVKYDADPIFRYTPGGESEIRYLSGNSGGYVWNAMCVGKDGKLFALPSPGYPEMAGTIEVGTYDPAAGGLAFTQQPLDDFLAVNPSYHGVSALFSAQAVGAPSLSYQWYFNSEPIPGANHEGYSILDVQSQHAGLYSVVVSDGKTSITSRPAKLTTQEASVISITGTGSSSGSGSGSASGSAGSGSASSGGGAFDQRFSLALLALLAAATKRRTGIARVADQ